VITRNFNPFPVLSTDRLTLRQLAISDDKDIFTLRTDPEINKFLNRQLSNTVDDARNFIKQVNENIDNNNSLYWAITLRGSNAFAGTICLFGFSDENRKCEIGYELLTNFQGQGIMKEAVEKVIDYAFNTIEVKRIDAYLHRDNQRSVNLLEKISFKQSDSTGDADPELICYELSA
jgi:ribosomal-protein-alanine N-acetyltransferase